ncbi:MAG: dehydrogenase E1 component subunit alpha/beta [Pyrinomonadaceae bacterium]|nr:dehydrogenase E1 component subunit alpha/beta [Pyrinomonadaceae bacterium]MBP6214106.1 dehydrogenase E1 component subunit alpha/beta [Pyrinomonadaceae bacterium]
MATGTKKNSKSVIAETAKTTEADGYIADAKTQKTAKAQTPAAGKAVAKSTAKYHGLDTQTLIGIYRTMYTSRRVDDKEIQLKGQNKIFFQISGAGHEGVLAGAALAMKPGYDWFFPYYRDRALMLGLGMTAQEMLWSAVGAEKDPNSHGRQMPSHWGSPELNVPSQSSCTGSQALHAVGAAEASYRAGLVKGLKEKITGFKGDEVVYMSVGDGTTSEGEWWEALNTAANLKLPVIFVVEDNGYAISTPVEVGTAGGDISKLVVGFPDLYIQNVDGTDPLASYEVFKNAVAYCRARKGPAFVHAKVIRPYSHSLSDDEKLYRPTEELEADAATDPIRKYAEFLMTEGIASSEALEALRKEVDVEINEASDIAIETPQPAPESAYRNVFSPDIDPTDRQLFDTEDGAELSGNAGTMVDLINRCMHEEMARDERIVVFGEDVADCSREQYLDQVKGKGGVFKVTANLQREFGSARVFNSPLAEANIIGRAVGMALRNLKPVVEIQFFDYIFPAFHQIRNEVAVTRWRSDGDTKCPMVMRVPVGGYLKGGAVYHSQSGTTLFSHTPGLMIVYPSTALDANGLLRTAIRCDDPVMFLEHKHLYRQVYNKSQYPSSEFLIPFGKAKKVREGNDVTIVTFGALVERSNQACKRLEQQGITVDLIDLRTLVPYDWEAIAESVKKTSRVIVAHEDPVSYGYGAEIAARISDKLFEYLDAPVRRVGATDTFVAYAPQVEDFILPQSEDVEKAVQELMKY